MDSTPTAPRLYTDLAAWWPLLSSPDDYAEEAAFYRRCLVEGSRIPVRTVLELGSGGGNNASHLRAFFELTLVDAAPAMLKVSRLLNPECEHVHADMRDARLGRLFDAVFVHDAVSYLTSEADLARTFETAWAHCRPGGVALFCPDHLKETFRPRTGHGGHDRMLRSLRYLEWMWDPDPSDTSVVCDFAFLLRDKDGVRVEYDRHVLGLFPRSTWLRLLADPGFRVTTDRFESSGPESEAYEVFIAAKPGEDASPPDRGPTDTTVRDLNEILA
ncbi:class I SAM-dependent methyltransferase [candidate division WOR-3 bacterium]|nr:class I SAM-dependent methyltransferase [candidate division WOR-3 bacterium]